MSLTKYPAKKVKKVEWGMIVEDNKIENGNE